MTGRTNIITTILFYGALLTGLILWAPWGDNGENIRPYHFYYLLLACIIWGFSYKYFGGRFVRPKWKIPGKLIGYLIISFILLILIDHYALLFIIGHQALGGIGHYVICKKHDINFWTCEPEAKYLELTEKWAKGNFKKE
ncbi:MAG: hypothetical protein MRY83_08900 [Flavobacteriales bacterium]|nr:hypothetical protein [Flavobacteriales bacterium]